MQYHHLYSDEAGESHWRDVDVALEVKSFAPPAQSIEISRARAGVRVTASDGGIRDIGAGDVCLMEDVGGKGHHTHVTSDDDFEAVIVQHD